MEIRHHKVGIQHQFGLDTGLREAMATYCRHRWPSNTAKHAAREWGLTIDEAKGLCLGRSSLATLERVWKHPRGGWSVLLPMMGAVIGQSIDDFHQNERKAHAEQARRHGAMVRDLRPVSSSRNGTRSELDLRSSEEPRAFSRRLVVRTHRQAEGEG